MLWVDLIAQVIYRLHFRAFYEVCARETAGCSKINPVDERISCVQTDYSVIHPRIMGYGSIVEWVVQGICGTMRGGQVAAIKAA